MQSALSPHEVRNQLPPANADQRNERSSGEQVSAGQMAFPLLSRWLPRTGDMPPDRIMSPLL